MAAYPNVMSAILPPAPVDTSPVGPPPQRLASNGGVGASELPLRGIRTTYPTDVICGRGGAALRHPGNQTYRRIVNLNKGLYATCLKPEKLKISKSIVAAIREQNGRFLERDNNTSTWYDIGDKKAVEKTSQALREGQPKLRQKIEELERSTGINVTNGQNHVQQAAAVATAAAAQAAAAAAAGATSAGVASSSSMPPPPPQAPTGAAQRQQTTAAATAPVDPEALSSDELSRRGSLTMDDLYNSGSYRGSSRLSSEPSHGSSKFHESDGSLATVQTRNVAANVDNGGGGGGGAAPPQEVERRPSLTPPQEQPQQRRTSLTRDQLNASLADLHASLHASQSHLAASLNASQSHLHASQNRLQASTASFHDSWGDFNSSLSALPFSTKKGGQGSYIREPPLARIDSGQVAPDMPMSNQGHRYGQQQQGQQAPEWEMMQNLSLSNVMEEGSRDDGTSERGVGSGAAAGASAAPAAPQVQFGPGALLGQKRQLSFRSRQRHGLGLAGGPRPPSEFYPAGMEGSTRSLMSHMSDLSYAGGSVRSLDSALDHAERVMELEANEGEEDGDNDGEESTDRQIPSPLPYRDDSSLEAVEQQPLQNRPSSAQPSAAAQEQPPRGNGFSGGAEPSPPPVDRRGVLARMQKAREAQVAAAEGRIMGGVPHGGGGMGVGGGGDYLINGGSLSIRTDAMVESQRSIFSNFSAMSSALNETPLTPQQRGGQPAEVGMIFTSTMDLHPGGINAGNDLSCMLSSKRSLASQMSETTFISHIKKIGTGNVGSTRSLALSEFSGDDTHDQSAQAAAN